MERVNEIKEILWRVENDPIFETAVEREVQGEYGLYNIKGSVITVNEEFAFSNENDVKSWASESREELLKQIEEIKTKINNINNRENEAIEVIKTFM